MTEKELCFALHLPKPFVTPSVVFDGDIIVKILGCLLPHQMKTEKKNSISHSHPCLSSHKIPLDVLISSLPPLNSSPIWAASTKSRPPTFVEQSYTENLCPTSTSSKDASTIQATQSPLPT